MSSGVRHLMVDCTPRRRTQARGGHVILTLRCVFRHTTMFGRVLHVFVDVMLISVVLSGIKRNTGLTVALHRIRHTEVRKMMSAYLEMGEWVCTPRR